MIIPMPFYRGNPPDGTAASNSTAKVVPFDLGVQVPSGKKWRIEEIVICNFTQVTGYYTVAIFALGSGPPAWDVAAMDSQSPLPRSIAGGPNTTIPGYYIASSQAIPPATTRTMPIVAYALGDERLWAGVYPGQNAFLGAGGVSMSINGREIREG